MSTDETDFTYTLNGAQQYVHDISNPVLNDTKTEASFEVSMRATPWDGKAFPNMQRYLGMLAEVLKTDCKKHAEKLNSSVKVEFDLPRAIITISGDPAYITKEAHTFVRTVVIGVTALANRRKAYTHGITDYKNVDSDIKNKPTATALDALFVGGQSTPGIHMAPRAVIAPNAVTQPPELNEPEEIALHRFVQLLVSKAKGEEPGTLQWGKETLKDIVEKIIQSRATGQTTGTPPTGTPGK